MADVQTYFNKFHREILLSDSDGKANLPKKRETLISNLKDGLKKWADLEEGRTTPTFEHFNQGSYAMYTGMKPLNDDYDIDVGIIFEATKNDWPCPVELKKIVRDALDHNSRTISIRRPCVTVKYSGGNSSDYHVDLAIYIKSRLWEDKLYIAMGKEFSEEENKTWDHSDPNELIDAINNKHDGDDRKQFKRCIRYLKRWRDNNFSSNTRLISIALTSAAHAWFAPKKSIGVYNDNDAMLTLTNMMLDNFSYKDNNLTVNLPVEPYSNLLEKMTDKQMESFKSRLESFRDSLQSAKDAESKEDAVSYLTNEFGDEFPDYEAKSYDAAEAGGMLYIATGNAA